MNGRIAQQRCWQGSNAQFPSGSPRIQPQVCPHLDYTAACYRVVVLELLLPCCCYRHSGHLGIYKELRAPVQPTAQQVVQQSAAEQPSSMPAAPLGAVVQPSMAPAIPSNVSVPPVDPAQQIDQAPTLDVNESPPEPTSAPHRPHRAARLPRPQSGVGHKSSYKGQPNAQPRVAASAKTRSRYDANNARRRLKRANAKSVA